MSISSIVQIASRLLGGDSGQDSKGQGKSKVAPAASPAQNNRTEFGDRFTPSAPGDAVNAAGGTGLFQVEQLRFTAVNIQTPAGNTAAGTAAAAASIPATVAAPPAVTANPGAPATTATSPVATTTSPIQTQQDLQALNASLTSLGLNAAEIAAFDQFAGVLLQFDPAALRDLQNQLNLLAARFQTQSAAPAATPQPPATSPNFQLTELSVSFTGLNETLRQGSQGNGNGTTAQISAFSLQIQEVRVTLSNPTGQTAQLQVPQAGVSTATNAAPAGKAATA
jgi:hypothetical protein